jgi:glycosyltransferase involved in cell wall biosynthesis
VIGYVGRLTHLKGVDLLASAFHEIARVLPSVKLLILGSGAEERFIRATLAEEIAHARAHIESDVDHDKISDWYRAMDLLVMPSRYENFSNTMLEAMACGIPFLASGVGGNKLLGETGSGWLFEAASVSSLVSSLRRILEDRPAIMSRGKIGRRHVQSLYSWEASAKRLEEIMMFRLGVR